MGGSWNKNYGSIFLEPATTNQGSLDCTTFENSNFLLEGTFPGPHDAPVSVATPPGSSFGPNSTKECAQPPCRQNKRRKVVKEPQLKRQCCYCDQKVSRKQAWNKHLERLHKTKSYREFKDLEKVWDPPISDSDLLNFINDP